MIYHTIPSNVRCVVVICVEGGQVWVGCKKWGGRRLLRSDCSPKAVKRIGANLKHFGSTTAPRNGGGRRPSLTPAMRDALREYLVNKPITVPRRIGTESIG
jgi:hypothetical protein